MNAEQIIYPRDYYTHYDHSHQYFNKGHSWLGFFVEHAKFPRLVRYYASWSPYCYGQSWSGVVGYGNGPRSDRSAPTGERGVERVKRVRKPHSTPDGRKVKLPYCRAVGECNNTGACCVIAAKVDSVISFDGFNPRILAHAHYGPGGSFEIGLG